MSHVDLLAFEPHRKSRMRASRFIGWWPSAGRELVIIAYCDLDGDLHATNFRRTCDWSRLRDPSLHSSPLPGDPIVYRLPQGSDRIHEGLGCLPIDHVPGSFDPDHRGTLDRRRESLGLPGWSRTVLAATDHDGGLLDLA